MNDVLLGGDLGTRRRTPTLPDDRESILAAADGFLLAMAKQRMSIVQDKGVVPPLWKAQSARYKRIKPPHARGNRVAVGAAGHGVGAAAAAAPGAAAAALGATIARFLGRDYS